MKYYLYWSLWKCNVKIGLFVELVMNRISLLYIFLCIIYVRNRFKFLKWKVNVMIKMFGIDKGLGYCYLFYNKLMEFK